MVKPSKHSETFSDWQLHSQSSQEDHWNSGGQTAQQYMREYGTKRPACSENRLKEGVG